MRVSGARQPGTRLGLTLSGKDNSNGIGVPASTPSKVCRLAKCAQCVEGRKRGIFFEGSVTMVGAFQMSSSSPVRLTSSTRVCPGKGPTAARGVRVGASQSGCGAHRLMRLAVGELPSRMSSLAISMDHGSSLMALPPLRRSA